MVDRDGVRMKSLAILVAIAFVAIVASAGAAAPNQEPPYARSLRPKLEALVKEMLMPGAVVVVRSEKLGDWTTTFGTQKRGGSSVSPSTTTSGSAATRRR